jgi:hypothetical protein
MSSYLDRACQSIIELDKNIRFAGIASMDGEMIVTKYREGLTPLLTKQETSESVIHSLSRMKNRRMMEDKLGKTIFSITFYEKVKRMAMPIGEKGEYMLLVSFDLGANHEPIIWHKIMKLVEPYASMASYITPSNRST